VEQSAGMRLSRGQLWALATAAAIVGLALVPLIAASDTLSDRGLWIALDLVIGGGFAGVGLFAWYRRPDNRVGVLMYATAYAWYISLFSFTEPPLLFSIGFWLGNLFTAPVIHLVLAFPSGRLETATDRVLVALGYLTVTIGFLPIALFMDPSGLGCTQCPENLFLVDSKPSFAGAWLDAVSVVGIVVLLAVVVRLVQRWRQSSGPLRRIVTPVFVSGGLLMATLVVLLVMGLAGTSEQVTEIIYYSALLPFGLVPYLFLAGLLRGRMLRGRGLGSLMRRLGGSVGRGELRSGLAEALGDPSVEVAYWLPEPQEYVDADGRPVELPAEASGRAVTEVKREGRRIAAIVHDPTLLEDPEPVREACAAAGLALENERLEAELRAKVEELRGSRARLVEVGLRQRRRLERDLHDGAQQRLVSLALLLRLARESLDSKPVETGRLLDRSRDELEEALNELRELARGIHPAVLSDRGLGAAVEALAQRAPLPVEVGELPAATLPEHIELAAYFVVSESLTNIARYAAATHATVAVTQSNGRLIVEVTDDGVGGADLARGTGLRGLIDRLAAIDGRLDVDSEPGRGTTVRASIPLA
jgi:signal transduction histidine kinase